MLGLSILPQLLFHFCLGGNPCMIGTWKPESGVSLLAGTAGKNVLNRIVEDMAHG